MWLCKSCLIRCNQFGVAECFYSQAQDYKDYKGYKEYKDYKDYKARKEIALSY